MNATEQLILPEDLTILAVAELSASARSRLKGYEDSFAVSHRTSRSADKLVDSRGADLLGLFRSGSTITAAVAAYATSQGLDPFDTLETAYPLIRSFVKAGFLVPADSAAPVTMKATLSRHERIDQFEICTCMQVLEDTELYQARDRSGSFYALKIQRGSEGGVAARRLRREADLLADLDGSPTPRLVSLGSVGGLTYLAMEWIPGVFPTVLAGELRQGPDGDRREKQWRLCRELFRAFSSLHAAGVVHGDVCPRNILVGQDGSVRLVDLGYARRSGDTSRVPRGTAGYWYEPELASARESGTPDPVCTEAGDQFCVAALAYLVIVGRPALDFSPVKTDANRQLIEEDPLPFADRGQPPWPAAEVILIRAMRKDAADRFASMATLLSDWNRIRPEPASPVPNKPHSRALQEFGEQTLGSLREQAPSTASWTGTPPTASINYGTGGVSYALYRLACLRADAQLLTAADAWLTKAEASSSTDDGFYNAELPITRDQVGDISPYHSESGIQLVRALVGLAMGMRVDQAVGRFIQVSSRPCDRLDVTLGRAGSLLGASILMNALAAEHDRSIRPLLAFGDSIRNQLLEVAVGPRSTFQDEELNVGMAHGWGGLLYSLMHWCRATSTPIHADVRSRLDELASMAEPWGRGLRWPRSGRADLHEGIRYSTSWCNGSAGLVFLWTLAQEQFKTPEYGRLAIGAAWNAWEEAGNAATLCCGLAGISFALLNLYRSTGDHAWLARAAELGERAVRRCKVGTPDPGDPSTMSLFKGEVGVAMLAAELDHPELSCMPLFEPEPAVKVRAAKEVVSWPNPV